MKWFGLGALIFGIGLLIALAMTPARFVMEQVSARDPSVRYAVADGTAWDGTVHNVMYGIQPVGTLSFQTQWTDLLTGSFSSDFQLTGGGITGQGNAAYGLGGSLRLKDLRMTGATRELLNLQEEVRDLNGQFTLTLSDLTINSNRCTSASGTVWTDILTRTESRWNWRGPELSGTVDCQNGKLQIALAGESQQFERVNANIEVGLDATGSFFTEVFTQNTDTANALSLLGFVSEGDNRYTYRHSIE